MGRTQLFHIEEIQKGLCTLLKKQGFGSFSMQLVAKELQIPIGSLYHRYPSKIEMIADLWLSILQNFQNEFQKILLAEKDPIVAGNEAALQVASWMEKEPEFAYLLSSVRKEDLNHQEWSPKYKTLEKKLKIQLQRIWLKWSDHLTKSNVTAEEIFILKSVIVDIPMNVSKPFIGKKFPPYLFTFIESTYQFHISKLNLFR